MLTKILNNGLTERTDVLPSVIRALNGTWGSTVDSNDNEEINLGRPVITYVYSGQTLNNTRSTAALALILYTDGSSEIRKIEGEVSVSKEIAMAVMIGKN